MIIINIDLLERFRRSAKCEWCGRPTPEGCDPAHIKARGIGGGSRLDIPINLVSLCRGWHKGQWISCHDDHHAGHITNDELFAVVAARENMLQDAVREEIDRLLRTPGDPSAKRKRKGMK